MQKRPKILTKAPLVIVKRQLTFELGAKVCRSKEMIRQFRARNYQSVDLDQVND